MFYVQLLMLKGLDAIRAKIWIDGMLMLTNHIQRQRRANYTDVSFGLGFISKSRFTIATGKEVKGVVCTQCYYALSLCHYI